jgi:hypothetical protein
MKTIKDLPEHSRPLDIQREIDAERGLVESNRKLVEIFEQKLQAKLSEIWGEEESAKA